MLHGGNEISSGLWEDIHWLYLAMGHLIADDTESSECRYIPNEIMNCSVESNAPPIDNIDKFGNR